MPAILSYKKYLLLFPVFLISAVCFAVPVSGNHFSKDSNRSKIHIISSYDAQSIKARKNKKALFAELVATLQNDIAAEISSKTTFEPVIIPEIILTGEHDDSLLVSFIQKNNSSMTIIIKDFDIWFEQTGVEVTQENGSKSRTASFDICSNVKYHLYIGTKLQSEKETKYREHFTTRSVASGFLSVGPDIVGKRKDAILLMKNNAVAFMRWATIWLSAP